MTARHALFALACMGLAALPTGSHAQEARDPQTRDPLSGAALYADILTYESFGVHRYGSEGAQKAMDWIEAELKRAGLATTSQPLVLDRQYTLERASLALGNRSIDVVPHWWTPPAQARFALTAPVVSTGEAKGAFLRLSLPFDRGAYLGAAQREALKAAFARGPAAVLLTVQHPSGQPYLYNVDQAESPWPVPVIMVGTKDEALLDEAEKSGAPVSVAVEGSYASQVAGRNVIGRLDRGKARTVVVSTPVTSWFTSSCERGPGIAGFLALARAGKELFPDANLVFVATGGHEIGHGGMESFLAEGAPKPEETAVWAHFGASLACYLSPKGAAGGTNDALRVIGRSETLDGIVTEAFAAVKGAPLVGKQAAVGELRDIVAAGYPRFVGMAGLHTFFHTPADNARLTSPELLEPVARAFAAAVKRAAGP